MAAFGLLAGCQKDPTTGTTEVSDQIVESISKQPVGGGTVQVYHASTGGGYVPVDSPYPADAQGPLQPSTRYEPPCTKRPGRFRNLPGLLDFA